MGSAEEPDNILYSPFEPLPKYECNSFIELLLDKAKEQVDLGNTTWMVRQVVVKKKLFLN